ncbi:gamma DNA-directed DNA polymerase [Dendrothele bispora CBS 962.96]|uniref:Mitochondrial DNA polymerase catalytic subunit n=1 Tax=Dendrothele bispora (strain CBS 962.96) TaxID=1314807 RepID=A0A4S8MEH2_DENBC|nr:gamma DNA-directed DNA polymerase [Dendrothele bispora CBS 962.96]
MISRLSNSCLPRWFHSASSNHALKQVPGTVFNQPVVRSPTVFKYKEEGSQEKVPKKKDVPKERHAKRNAVGVQMLSKSLHEQIFKNCLFPPPPKAYENISLEHLKAHGLDPSQSSTVPSTEFTLPPLQGNNLLEHFHRIGHSSSEPYLSLAKQLAEATIPPIPENWDLQPGWTKYYHAEDGSGYAEHVEYPEHDGKPEQLLVFDIETMPKYHHYPVIACAASPNAWYVWLSPWILEPVSNSPEHLIPLGSRDVPRVVVGHNVSYDRARILEEYHLDGSKNRFLDTMSLHIAFKGISSHQRPAWMKHRKKKQDEADSRNEAIQSVIHFLHDVRVQLEALRKDIVSGRVVDSGQQAKLTKLKEDLEASLIDMQSASSRFDGVNNSLDDDDDISEATGQKRWEDLTSGNSLLDVAKLHCDIDISKEIRSDFMSSTPEEIRADLSDYIDYCASDVDVTYQVYKKVLPGFLNSCPHPVSFAGVIAMGSGFLPVNEQWEEYLRNAESTWNALEQKVRKSLEDLARAAFEEHKVSPPGEETRIEPKWKEDVWLSQMDWTPKKAGKTRGVMPVEVEEPEALDGQTDSTAPMWYAMVRSDPLSKKVYDRILPLLLQLSFESSPLRFTSSEQWHYLSPSDPNAVMRLPTSSNGRQISVVLNKLHAVRLLTDDKMSACDKELAIRISQGEQSPDIRAAVLQLAEDARNRESSKDSDPWLSQLDWEEVEVVDESGRYSIKHKAKAAKVPKPPSVYWPRWFWDLAKPKKDLPPGSLEITIRNRMTPLLLKMTWYDYPLFYSREYGWVFRVPSSLLESASQADAVLRHKLQRMSPLSFYDAEDEKLADATLTGGYLFYKLPHKDGDEANVGSPLTKSFLKFAVDGALKSSAGDELKELVEVGIRCSYWISARDRILNQMAVWDKKSEGLDMGFPKLEGSMETSPTSEGNQQTESTVPREKKWGLILPRVITMGTVTRRAIERTWLTASNAKKNRVGSELKAMVRAPPSYAIVGADVDSEELWISSCMGDAQFGMHGATAIGWMTLEGTKSAGTDLHSKTASILGISRDQAKVFNYSRIYGAGMRHAMLLLQQGSSTITPEEAHKLAENLYASTKGKNTHRTDIFERKFWYGGSESYLFNKLEEIALSDRPQTPALGCGVTSALLKECLPAEFGSDYMPSRINWVVQSSGVDYLHLLIVSMDHLIKKYGIEARYLISVHDELRYLVKEEDRYRAALALQIANLWTRCMFAYKLGMDDLPQGVAFFSSVDVDRVLRKEVDMPCVTPSHPNPIPPGESLNIEGILNKTNGGTLWKDGSAMETSVEEEWEGSSDGYIEADCLAHRAANPAFIRAQAASDFGEIKHLAKQVYGKKFDDSVKDNKPRKRKSSEKSTLGNGEGVDWAEVVDQLLKSGRELTARI